jgi:glycosyltransferase involved in cell wall biosynthesis
MRIGIVTWSARKVGGIETYLDRLLPALHNAGHQVALLSQVDSPAERKRICLPEGSPFYCVSTGDPGQALGQLRQWRPRLIYLQGLDDTALEAQLSTIAPVILFAHNYYGTCVDGSKLFSFPTARPCERTFGLGCLLNFYPRRCGGLNPITMARAYGEKATRLRILRDYRAILTASEHMRREYLRHGFAASAVHLVPLPVYSSHDNGGFGYESLDSPLAGRDDWHRETSAHAQGAKSNEDESNEDEWRLLFAGRMTRLKGGAVLLDAIPAVAAALGRPVRVTFAGEGPAREDWEAQGRVLEARHPNLRIEFVGWLDSDALDVLAKRIHLLVIPSLWPEPFGLVGPEFGLKGIPAAAFAVGGVPEWLTDGINGCLAPDDPPTAHGLAAAIIRCLHDSDEYARLRRGAVALAQRFGLARHLKTLMAIFDETTASASRDA